MHRVEIKSYIPGAIGRVAELHAVYYSRGWGFGQFFEAKVATELSAFLDRFDDNRDGLWTACIDNRVEGSIAIDGIKAETEGAHLRWYILSPRLHGRGIGNRLLDGALNFCRSKGYNNVYLWTFKGLDTARHLYEKNGFALVEEKKGMQWGTVVVEQKFILKLS